ncbi:unnamed protein product, partial [Staurois parvus]
CAYFSGLLTTAGVFPFFVIGCAGRLRASHSCCQPLNLPWAPITASSCCCQVQSLIMGPCTASHCCCLHRHTLPCATFRSPHTAGGFHFCHRVL